MKIAIVYLGRRGGGAVYSLNMAKALAKRAKVLAVVSRYAYNVDEWRDAGLPLLEVPTYHNALSFAISSLNIKKHIRIRNALRAFGPEVLYYPMLHLWVPILNWMLPDIPKVVTLHDPEPREGEHNPIHLVQSTAIRQAERVILLSERFVPILNSRGVPTAAIDVIPHGEFSYYRTIPNHKRPSRAGAVPAPTLLFFGRITPYKGLGTLLEAFPIIKEKVPTARLLIVGSGDIEPYVAQLVDLADVEVVNRWIDDAVIQDYFTRASALVVPYVDASQSGVIPIAYAFKVPVVATKVGGIPEQVEDGITGFLVEPENATALAQVCISLLSNPLLGMRLGEGGYKKALTEWNWEKVASLVFHSCEKTMKRGED